MEGLAAVTLSMIDEKGGWETQRQTDDHYSVCEKPPGKEV